MNWGLDYMRRRYMEESGRDEAGQSCMKHASAVYADGILLDMA